MTEIERDIGTALTRLRSAFAKHNIPCPDVLEYSDVPKGYEALGALRYGLGPTLWVMDPNATAFGEACLAGFTVRFKGRSIERPGTGAELDDGVSGRVFDVFEEHTEFPRKRFDDGSDEA